MNNIVNRSFEITLRNIYTTIFRVKRLNNQMRSSVVVFWIVFFPFHFITIIIFQIVFPKQINIDQHEKYNINLEVHTCLSLDAFKHISINIPTGTIFKTRASHGGTDGKATIIAPTININIVPGVNKVEMNSITWYTM